MNKLLKLKWKNAQIWFSNNFRGTQYCSNCGTNLKNEPIDGFDELDHGGTGKRKWCPKCKKPFFV